MVVAHFLSCLLYRNQTTGRSKTAQKDDENDKTQYLITIELSNAIH